MSRGNVRRGWMLVLVAVLWLAAPGSAAAQQQACRGDPTAVRSIHLTVDGGDARGLYVLPARRPRALVVFAHGYSYNDYAWVNHMLRAAKVDGGLSVTMNYRGLKDLPADSTGYPRSRGWPVKTGAQDLIAAARYFDSRCGPFDRIILLGVSMGGNASGLAAAADAKRIDGTPLFDYWVGIEGVYNVTELWSEASALAPTSTFAANAKADVEAEMGGPYPTHSATFANETVVDRVADIARSGLKGAYIVHGVEDGLAAYNQAQELTTLLRADGMPTDLYSVTHRAPGDTPDTTLAGYVGVTSGNAGHGSEWSMHHIVLDTGFDRITASLVRGEPPPCNRDFVVDGTATPRISPDPAVRPTGCPAGHALPRCAPATGLLQSRTLGLLRLGMTRSQARRAYRYSQTRGRRHMDFFCLSPIGVRAGYASRILLRHFPAKRSLRGRVVLALTANPFYSLRGVRPGDRLAAAARRLRAGAPFHVGLNYWYFAPNRSSTAVLKVLHGVVEEIGIANKQLTKGRKAQLRFIKSFS